MQQKLITVAPNDTLSHIAKRHGVDYHTIAAINNIKDVDKIYVGQKLAIPVKFNKPLKKAEIPTSNKTIVIDNYSPNYNYIVENDKIYYSRKDRDHWVDISDNETARKNLYDFIGTKYNFKGYEDDEKNIWNRVKKNDFNYAAYRDSINNSYTQRPAELPKPKTTLVPKSDTSNDQSNPAPVSKVQQLKIKSKTDGQQPVTEPRKLVSKVIAEPSDNTRVAFKGTSSSVINAPADLVQQASTPSKQETNQDSWDPDAWWNLASHLDKAKVWIDRQINKYGHADEESSKLQLPEITQPLESEYAFRPGSYTGDTIVPFKDHRYIVPESIDPNDYKFGIRNRGDLNPIETEGGVVTMFDKFLPFGKHVQGRQTYVGIDAKGNLIAGDISKFGPGSYLAPTFSNKVAGFAKDKDGNLKYTPSKKNPGKNQPVPILVDDNGRPYVKENSQAINILVNKGDVRGTYGNITGGRVLAQAGDELRILSGSVENISSEFEAMKKRNGVSYGTFYTLDNGSYNIGLRTKNKLISKKDLQTYDSRNHGSGGNFLYLLPKGNQFPSDTILTPNVRTETSESYKKGHPLKNELLGVTLHHTAFMDPDLTGVVSHLTNPKTEASSHVVIGYDGSRKVLARPEQVTFHAGQSVWNNRENVNDFMLGIEFQGDTNVKDLTPEQVQSAIEYLKPILKQNNISLENIVTHEQVRNLYNDFAKKQKRKLAPNKKDVNQKNYEKIVQELLKQVYYKK